MRNIEINQAENDIDNHNASDIYDVAIIGGGINGAGIARDAAGRGLKVLLIESRDLAQATSSASSKMLHGGLRYLEYYEFSLVRKALAERETLMSIAPHIMWPLEFVLPHASYLRPRWMIRLGLWLYDHLAPRTYLTASKSLDLTDQVSAKDAAYAAPLHKGFRHGFLYSDGWVDDSRLVVLNAMDAADHGADIKTYEHCQDLTPLGEQGWAIKTDKAKYQARQLINATGPWVDQLLTDNGIRNDMAGQIKDLPHIRLVKGSHIIVPKLYDGDHSYLLQLKDGRVIFVFPYEGKYSLIGTTDIDYTPQYDDMRDVYDLQIDHHEMVYLCRAITENFDKALSPEDVLWAYSGVRPLMEVDQAKNASAVTRDYRLVKTEIDHAPLINIYGGKITTYRALAEDVMRLMGYQKSWGGSWTGRRPLPGGDIDWRDFQAFEDNIFACYPWMDQDILRRYMRSYGTRLHDILAGCKNLEDLGEPIGSGIYAVEIKYLIRHEMARTSEDVLFRRSKLGLHIDHQTRENIDEYMQKQLSADGLRMAN